MLAGRGATVLHHICTTTGREMTGGDHLLRVGEAAEILGVDGRRVYEAIDAGDLPACHVQGRGIRLRLEDVEEVRRRVAPRAAGTGPESDPEECEIGAVLSQCRSSSQAIAVTCLTSPTGTYAAAFRDAVARDIGIPSMCCPVPHPRGLGQ